jgi:hypothetical protein
MPIWGLVTWPTDESVAILDLLGVYFVRRNQPLADSSSRTSWRSDESAIMTLLSLRLGTRNRSVGRLITKQVDMTGIRLHISI